LAVGDEFCEGTVFSGTEEKIGKHVAQRAGNDEFRNLSQALRAVAFAVGDRLQCSFQAISAKTSADTAASIRMLPKAMHLVRRP
jgi:hypothetical protein